MAKAEASVETLVQRVESGAITLPEMQRGYVWRSPRVRDLLDSLYRGYPSGAILLWETDQEVPGRQFSIQTQPTHAQGQQLLLDGQQRLTSLAAVIRGNPVNVRGRSKPIELLFNLEHPEGLSYVTEVQEDADEDTEDDEADASEDELQKRFDQMTFIVSTSKLESLPNWVKVTDVFKSHSDAPFLQRAGVTNFDDPRYQKYSQRLAKLRAIKEYVYRMDILEKKLDYEEVTEIFVRVNSLGAKLRSSDLALAQITARWRHSLETFLTYQSKCAEADFLLDLSIHLKALVVHATGQSKFKTVSSLSIERLKESWGKAQQATDFALDFLKSNASIDSPALLSSPFMVISLGYFGAIKGFALSPAETAALRRWVLLANAKGRYSRGSSETLLDQDLVTIRDTQDPNQLIERLRQQVGTLTISAAELQGRNQRSALFKSMFLAFRQAGAADWISNLNIDVKRSRDTQHSLQFHHVFPKAVLKKVYNRKEINDIANLAFIEGKTNKKILAKEPLKYLPGIIEKQGVDFLSYQAMPDDLRLYEVDNYHEFLNVRRKLIADKLNHFLEH